MTKASLLRKLQELTVLVDPEAAHTMADQLLLAYIHDPEITEAHSRVAAWCA